jgi:hypothetical protein
LVATRQLKTKDITDQTQGRSAKSALKLHNPCIGQSTPSLSLGKTIGYTYQTPGPTRWSSMWQNRPN